MAEQLGLHARLTSSSHAQYRCRSTATRASSALRGSTTRSST